MKHFRLVSVPLLLFLVVFMSSCSSRLSVQKRHYRPGYHVEYARIRKHVDQDSYKRVQATHTTDAATETIAEQIQPPSISLASDQEFPVGPVAELMAEQGVGSVRGIEQGTTAEVRKDLFRTEASWALHRFYGRSFSRERYREIAAVEEEVTPSLVALPENQGGGNSAMRAVGIVLASIGFLIFLFVSWLIGLILVLLGLGLIIGGAGPKGDSVGSNRKSKQSDEQVWQDVVYLKNGSVIKGMIIEQVPNESLKIQTADGSIFVYEMTQVSKIAKEPKQD